MTIIVGYARTFGYRANAVSFDGTNDYLTRGADLTGTADSKLITGSFWIRKQGSDAATERVFSCASAVGGGTFASGFRISKNSNDGISCQGTNAAGTNILIVTSSNDSVEVADAWVHVLFSFNMANAAERFVYINDAADITVSTYTDDTIDLSCADWSVGAMPDGTGKLTADLADLWIEFGVFTDFSVEANRRKFISATGRPVDLGADGSTPLGSAPIIFFHGATAGWETNDGDGGGFTENGALTTAATSPSD